MKINVEMDELEAEEFVILLRRLSEVTESLETLVKELKENV
jgi:hypothetical protein|tara:strand:- start:498 stop:620 length:123 start_codon:yes stop_codon:yes gene_type:complete